MLGLDKFVHEHRQLVIHYLVSYANESGSLCPHNVGLNNICEIGKIHSDCEACWTNALTMEYDEKENEHDKK